MKINLETPSPSFESIFNNPNQIITLDANFFIPPYRSFAKIGFTFDKFKIVWLDLIFSVFPNLAIHEAVYDEIISESAKDYIETLLNDAPPRIIVHKDSTLTANEEALRCSVESKLYPNTKYDPILDNKDDRGEVKSLSYISVKGLLYFASHDNNAIHLIEKSKEWSTGLDNVQAIKMYEIIYYLYNKKVGNNDSLKMLYKYQYYFTEHEKKINPNWGEFIELMDKLYQPRK